MEHEEEDDDHHTPYPSFVSANKPKLDADMAFSESLRSNGIFMYVSNEMNYGHLVDPEAYSTKHLNNDLYEIQTNKIEWEKRYLHENYSKVLSGEHEIQQPCPDVFWFPVVSEKFCSHLISEMEHFGKWSDGSNRVSISLFFPSHFL